MSENSTGNSNASAESSLFHNLCQSKTPSLANLKVYARTWIENYEKDRESGLHSLVSLIFQACDCSISDIELPVDGLWTHFVRKIEDKIDAKDPSVSRRVHKSEQKRKAFMKNVCNLMNEVLLIGQNQILCDEFFSCNFLGVLNDLSRSSFRDFRQTGTFIALKMTTSLSNIMRSVVTQQKVSSRQLSLEKSKKMKNRSSELIERLEAICDEADHQIYQVDGLIQYITKRIIPERFRDMDSDIRAMCLEEFEEWVHEFCQVFLKPKYIGYLIHALNDSVAKLRKKSLEILKWIYSNCEFQEMDQLTKACKGVVISMAVKENIHLSCLAIQLISLVVQKNSEALEDYEKECIQYLAYSLSQRVSHEVGLFFHQCIEYNLKDLSVVQSYAISYILEIKDFVMKNNGLEKVPLLVDSLWVKGNKYLMNWKSYVDLLLFDEDKRKGSYLQRTSHIGCEALHLDDMEEKILISILANCVQQVATGESPRKKVEVYDFAVSKSSKFNAADVEKMTKQLLPYLPKILSKYMFDSDNTINLLTLCSHLHVEYADNHKELHDLGEVLIQIPGRSVDSEVHLACAKAVAHLCGGESTASKYCSSYILKPFLDEIVEKWDVSLRSYVHMCSEKEDIQDILDEHDIIHLIENNSSIIWSTSCYLSLEDYLDWDEICEMCKGKLGRGYPLIPKARNNLLKTAFAMILREAVEKRTEEELFKIHVSEFQSIAEENLKSEVECSVQNVTYLCLSEVMCMMYYPLMTANSDWMEIWGNISIIIVKYFLAVLNNDDEFYQLSKEEKVEVVKSYCSSIRRKGLPCEAATFLLKNYNNQLISECGEDVNKTLLTLQSWGMENFSMILLDSLILFYVDILNKSEANDVEIKEQFNELMALAVQLKSLYGSKMVKNRKACLDFHSRGVEFASELKRDCEPPLPNIYFLHVLVVYAVIIHQDDLNNLIKYANKQLKSLKASLPPESKGSVTQLREYIGTLQKMKKQESKSARKSSRGRRNLLLEIEEAEADMDVDDP